MTRYPLLFTYHGNIAGNGFAAQIRARGRALMVDEGDGWWMYGLNPGPVADGGSSPAEANARFRKSFWYVMMDLAKLRPASRASRRKPKRSSDRPIRRQRPSGRQPS